MAAETAIVIHGGAGTIIKEKMSPDIEAKYRSVLKQSIEAGYAVLKSGGSSTDAVISSIKVMEDSPLFNAGHGAVFNHQGQVELDASIMNGDDLNAGAATGISNVRNPIVLAQKVMEESPHVMLMGQGAENFAKEQGLTIVNNEYFHTERRLRQLKKLQKSSDRPGLSESEEDEFETQKFSTVGAVAIDSQGRISAGTSTGGMTNKRYGRIGDSPIIGAGTYADSNLCGISATGHGEYFIRSAVAHDLSAHMEYKKSTLAQAARDIVQIKLKKAKGSGGIIGLDAKGNIVMEFNTPAMNRGSIDKNGKLTTGIFK